MPATSSAPVVYKGFEIRPKLDFGSRGFLIDGKWVKEGFVVCKGGCNVMPGATWFRTIGQAQAGIDAFILCDGNAEHFWEIMQPFGYKPGQKLSGLDSPMTSSISKGRFHARCEGGVVVEVWLSSSRPWDTAASFPVKAGTRDSAI